MTVIVADNDSRDADESRRISETYGAVFLEVGENLGYGGAVNAAVRSLGAETKYVLVSNPDVELGDRARFAHSAIDSTRTPARPQPVRACSTPTARPIRPPGGCRRCAPASATRCSPASGRATRGRAPIAPTSRSRRARRRLAERIVRAAASQRLRCRRRLRRGLLHVLRGRRPRIPARPRGLVEPLRARAPGSCTPAPTRPRTESTRMLQGAPRQRVPLPRRRSTRAASSRRCAGRCGSGSTVRSRIVTMRVERAQRRSLQAQAPSSPSR